MRNIYILLIIITISTIHAQTTTTVNFTAAEGYVQGNLANNADWGGANWIASPDNSRIECAGGYSWARWGVPFTVSGTEITFEVHFRFNIDLPANKLIARMGFNDNGANAGNIANIQLSTLSDGNLYVRHSNGSNGNPDSGAAGLTDFQQDNLVLKVTLTLGADADSSTISSKMFNSTAGIDSGIAIINGIPAGVFTKATSSGISGFIHVQNNISGTRNILVDKVIMTQGNTLSFDRTAELNFSLSQNPVQNVLGITGLETGSQISIYSISGAKVYNQEFNGNSINVSNLNTGLYFLEIPGYSVKKFLKK
jgi:hypothetical protein